jgi:hypothetical protein
MLRTLHETGAVRFFGIQLRLDQVTSPLLTPNSDYFSFQVQN